MTGKFTRRTHRAPTSRRYTSPAPMAGNAIPGDGSPFSETCGANGRRWTESHWWPRPAPNGE
ncbi:unnamed protein product [Fusarium graminearum]|nr:unnamed protein product [Fusarium graminearum]CAG1972335.1 unnamed protein product [Fusarium graminearum]VTO94165.1 unnamed protein product [Fusarium graminearum]